MPNKKQSKSIPKTTKATLWNFGRGQRDISIFELCGALIADSICPGATGLGPDLHWVILRYGKIFKTLRKATDDEVINFIRRTVIVAFSLTDVCEDYATSIIDIIHMDHGELVKRAIDDFWVTLAMKALY